LKGKRQLELFELLNLHVEANVGALEPKEEKRRIRERPRFRATRNKAIE